MSTNYQVQVLDRVFSILDEIAHSQAPLGPTDLGQKLRLNKSTVHRLLAVLERYRYLEREEATGRYRLGLRPVELGSVALARLDLHGAAKPYVERLARETGETAHVGILRQGEVVSLVNAESHRTLRTPSTVGRRTPVHCTSLGKALLAYQPPPAAEAILRSCRFTPYTRRTIRRAGEFRAELARVRSQGFAIDNEEFEEGLRCVGAPVRDHTGEVIAAISIAGPAFRVTPERTAELIRSVVNVAGDLSASLGWRPSAAATAPRAGHPGKNGTRVRRTPAAASSRRIGAARKKKGVNV